MFVGGQVHSADAVEQSEGPCGGEVRSGSGMSAVVSAWVMSVSSRATYTQDCYVSVDLFLGPVSYWS